MGNETSSLVQKLGKAKRVKNKEKSLDINEMNNDVVSVPLYKKKARRVSSTNRFNSVVQNNSDKQRPPPSPIPIPVLRSTASSPNMKDLRRSSISRTPVNTPPSQTSSSSSLLLVPGKDRRRSRSLCGPTMQADVQEVASKAGSRKNSSVGLVPQLNRLRIQQCFKSAKPSIGDLIMKRASSTRQDFRLFINNLSEEQLTSLSESTYTLINDAVENIERAEKVLSQATRYGESFVALCPIGFRPDLFSVLADACIAECVRLDGGAHKRCETLLAWSQLFAAIFSSVRDGYYQRVRCQRRASLPQYAVVRQQSIENSNPSSRESEKDD